MITETIAVQIAEIEFIAIPLEHEGFAEHDVVYVVLSRDYERHWSVLDVGHSNGGRPFHSPERRACWLRHSTSRDLWVGVHLMASDRCMPRDFDEMVEKIRGRYRPPCHEA